MKRSNWRAYTTCEECELIAVKRPDGSEYTKHPWCEFDIEFRDNFLYRINVVELETK
jgi:hypothetical protein